jgi:hypothetical protein
MTMMRPVGDYREDPAVIVAGFRKIQFGEDAAHMLFGGALGDPQLAADVRVGTPLGHQRQHLLFAGAEHREGVVAAAGRNQVGHHQVGRLLADQREQLRTVAGLAHDVETRAIQATWCDPTLGGCRPPYRRPSQRPTKRHARHQSCKHRSNPTRGLMTTATRSPPAAALLPTS